MKKLKVSAFSRMVKLGTAITKASAHIAMEKIQEKIAESDQLRKIQSQVSATGEIVKVMSEMRGGVMKLGQMISITDDLLMPPEITSVFKQLQKNASIMTDKELNQVFKKNFKLKPEQLFDYFERKPFAAASIGQVHRGRLKTGENVAIKVQYPDIVRAIKNDFSNLVKLDELFALLYKNKPNLDLVVDELKHSLVLECDYLHELKQMKFFKEELEKEFKGIYVPQTYSEFCTSEVLTMEFVSGDSFEESLNYTQDEKNFLGKTLYESFLYSLWGLNRLHTDPQNGNYLFQRDKMIILDFGSTRTFDLEFLSFYFKLFQACEMNDFPAYCLAGKKLEFFEKDEEMEVMNNHYEMVQKLYYPYLQPGTYAVKNLNPVQLLKNFVSQISFKGRSSPRREFLLLDRTNLGIFTKLNRWESEINWLSGLKKYRDPYQNKILR
jgi:predicted unusual protein kinase regulating ubiquinone biosynthesis (AarF/ABC1/UbiB family)